MDLKETRYERWTMPLIQDTDQ